MVSRQLLVLDTVSLPLSFLPSPLACLDARRDGGEWFVFNPRGLRKALELETRRDWKHRVGLRGRPCAILAGQ